MLHAADTLRHHRCPWMQFVRHEDVITPEQTQAWLSKFMSTYGLKQTSKTPNMVANYKGTWVSCRADGSCRCVSWVEDETQSTSSSAKAQNAHVMLAFQKLSSCHASLEGGGHCLLWVTMLA